MKFGCSMVKIVLFGLDEKPFKCIIFFSFLSCSSDHSLLHSFSWKTIFSPCLFFHCFDYKGCCQLALSFSQANNFAPKFCTQNYLTCFNLPYNKIKINQFSGKLGERTHLFKTTKTPGSKNSDFFSCSNFLGFSTNRLLVCFCRFICVIRFYLNSAFC